MMHTLAKGAIAGAVGTVALNVITYADMLLRARPASSVPAEVADKLAERADMDLGEQEAKTNRTQAGGALMGYVAGLGVAIGYSLSPSQVRNMPWWVTGPLLGAAAMAGSDVPAAGLGVTKPTTWGISAWLSDIVPHMAYGATTAAVYRALHHGAATAPRRRFAGRLLLRRPVEVAGR